MFYIYNVINNNLNKNKIMEKNFTEAQLNETIKVLGNSMDVRINRAGNINLEPKNALDPRTISWTFYINTNGKFFARATKLTHSGCEMRYPLNIKWKKGISTYYTFDKANYKIVEYEVKVRDWENSGIDTFEEFLDYMKNYLTKLGYKF